MPLEWCACGRQKPYRNTQRYARRHYGIQRKSMAWRRHRHMRPRPLRHSHTPAWRGRHERVRRVPEADGQPQRTLSEKRNVILDTFTCVGMACGDNRWFNQPEIHGIRRCARSRCAVCVSWHISSGACHMPHKPRHRKRHWYGTLFQDRIRGPGPIQPQLRWCCSHWKMAELRRGDCKRSSRRSSSLERARCIPLPL